MLVSAYIRELHTAVLQHRIVPLELVRIVPLELVTLCEMFYYSHTKFICLMYDSLQSSAEKRYQLFTADFSADGSITDSDSIYVEPVPSSIKYPDSSTLSLDDEEHISTFYFARNVMLPTTYHCEYDAIFQNDGSETLKAVLINRDTYKAWNYVLPKLPTVLVDNCLVHSHKHGLFSIGGYDMLGNYNENKIYHLPASINKQTTLSWRWNDHFVPKLKIAASKQSALIIKIDHKEHLFLSGGVEKINSSDKRLSYAAMLFPLDTEDETSKTWKELGAMKTREWCGYDRCMTLHFDAAFNRVYAHEQFSVGYYDLCSDRWFKLPEIRISKGRHLQNSAIWKRDENILCVVMTAQQLLSLDLREAKGQKLILIISKKKNAKNK